MNAIVFIWLGLMGLFTNATGDEAWRFFAKGRVTVSDSINKFCQLEVIWIVNMALRSGFLVAVDLRNKDFRQRRG